MNKQKLKKALLYFFLILFGFIIASAPIALNNFKNYAAKAKTVEAKLLLRCVHKHSKGFPQGLINIDSILSVCTKENGFEIYSRYYRSVKKMLLPSGDELLVVWGNPDERDGLNLDVWAQLNGGPPVHCIDGTGSGWNSDRINHKQPCDFLKLNSSIELK